MATKGNSNRTQKNGVRYALATAATMMTLLGAQSLAFAGRSATSATPTETSVAIVPTGHVQTQVTVASASPTDTVTATQVASPTTVPTVIPTTVQPTQIT